MKTFSNLLTLTAEYCNVNTQDTTAMATITTNINDSIRTICNLQGGKLRFLETTETMLTVANQDAYQTPNNIRKIIDLYVTTNPNTSTSTVYIPEMIFDPVKWKYVIALRLGYSDWPYFTYVENQVFRIQPIPSSGGNTITIRGRLQTADLTMQDYTVGEVVTLANGDINVIGSGTTWTEDMVGRYLQIPQTQAAGGGDGMWYQIGSWTDATHVALLKPYQGTALSSATANYIIGECSVIPEAYDVAIVYRATALYWQNQNDLVRSKTYWTLYDGGNEAGYTQIYGGLIGQMLANEGETEEGAYIPPFQRDRGGATWPPYWLPYQDAQGFTL